MDTGEPGPPAAGDTAGAAPDEPAAAVTVLRGVIDLVYDSGDGWRIVDYKTDQILVSVDELVPRYGAQVAPYREAWTRVSTEPVSVAELFHIRTVQSVPVP